MSKGTKKKPFYKKWWFWTIVVIFVIGIGFSGGDDDSKKEIISSDQSEEKDVAEQQKDTSEEQQESEDLKEDQKKNDNTTIEQLVIFDHDGVTITATEYVTDSIWGESVKLLIENNSDKAVGIGCNALIVNNYMIGDLFSTTVAAGKKSNETLNLYSAELEAAGIENVGQIEIYFYLYDADTYETIYTADSAVIKTSKFADMDITAEDAGVELYNENGVRIVGKYVDEDSIWGSAVLLYMENNTGKNINVSCENLSVNGYMVTSFLYTAIYNGKMAIDEITLFMSDLEANGITSIDEIELVFNIVDADTYSTIATSDVVTFSVK